MNEYVKHKCSICDKDCGGCTSPAYQCVWLNAHQHHVNVNLDTKPHVYVDILMSERLRNWARNILESGGHDMRLWSNPAFVAQSMVNIAEGIESVINTKPRVYAVGEIEAVIKTLEHTAQSSWRPDDQFRLGYEQAIRDLDAILSEVS